MQYCTQNKCISMFWSYQLGLLLIFSHNLTSPIISITFGCLTIVKNHLVTFGKCFLYDLSKTRVYAINKVIAIMMSANVIVWPTKKVWDKRCLFKTSIAFKTSFPRLSDIDASKGKYP